MKISRPKRPTTENASSEELSEAINIVSQSINSFMNEAYIAIMGNLSVTDNLDMSFKVVTVSVDENGDLNRPVSFRNGLSNRSQGIMVIRCFNAIPESQPFVYYSEESGVITILNVSGLLPNTEYQINLLIIGS